MPADNVLKGNFVALDVETANSKRDSICQIGIAVFTDGVMVDEWSSLIDPEDSFHFFNTKIHGLTSDNVAKQPSFPAIANALGGYLNSKICVSHSYFERESLRQASAKYGLKEYDAEWLDSSLVARRVWDEFSQKGYSLKNICEKIGYQFKHHDALEDAKAAGHIILAASRESGLNLSGLINLVQQPRVMRKRSYRTSAPDPAPNPEGILSGEIVAFTRLSIPRREAVNIAANAGCRIVKGCGKRTTILVTDDKQNWTYKLAMAEELIKEGISIRIIKETDFRDICAGTKSLGDIEHG